MPGADERKPVTVLFADLAGSTELATRHDAEPLRALLAAFFEEMRHQIEAFGGTVEKFAGDAVMAVFGVSAVHEDDAERAVRAAVAMRDAVAQLNPMFEQEYGTRLALRIGVATGEAVAASRPATDFMATGEVPNLAARLQSIADPIAVSEETYRLLAALLDAERTGPHVLKGFERPVAAWRVHGLRVSESRPRGVPGLTSAVVGRDRELVTLWSCVEDLRRGRGQILTITGEAGIGKSRVKIEIRDNLGDDIRWLEGRCQSYMPNTSYAPIVDVLRAALGLGASEAQAIARTRLRVALRALAGERADQVGRALAHLLGIDLGPAGQAGVAPDPQGRRSQLVLAARAVLEGLAQRSPVIVALEDLHWADAASVELLSVLAELTDFHPVMLLVTSRPETEGNAWTFRQHVERNYGHRLTELRLAPLAEADSRRLADNLLRVSELPESMREAILARAEGNPFFLEEILRALIEQGVLRREGDRWIVGEDPAPWPLPTTLRGVLAARIDRLPGAAKTILQHAAVVGRFFEYRTLAAIGGEPGEVDRARVAEESLPLAWEIGEQHVALFVSAWLGLAYLKLGRRDDARRVVERALRWGEARPGVTPFSLTYITIARALSHLADGEAEAAVQRARRAIELAGQSGFRVEQGAAHRALGPALEPNGQRGEAESSYRRSLELLESIQSQSELGQTLLALGRFKLAETTAEGRHLVERARAIFDAIGATGWSSEARTVLTSAA